MKAISSAFASSVTMKFFWPQRLYLHRLADGARTVKKKEVGDLAIVNTPAGEASWYVNEIEYVK